MTISAHTIEPVSLALGAVVHDVDLSYELDEPTWTSIKEAFCEHSVLIFRDQQLTIDEQRRFAERFGQVEVHSHLLPMTAEGHPECMVLHNNAQKPPGLNTWHTDNSGWYKPSQATVLYAKVTPQIGGDTLFANMFCAYEALSPAMQVFVAGLRAIHDVRKAFGPAFANLQNSLRKRGLDPDTHFAEYEPVAHPIVRTHPESRRRALYVSSPYITGIEGLGAKECDAVLGFLYEHIATNEFVYRHRWREGDLLVWDNRCTQHLAVADYFPHERLMHRINVAGDRPFFAADG